MEEIRKKIGLLKKREKRTEKIVVNAGLLKAGKSSLFNAFAGKQVFDTDVVRATVENKKLRLDKFVLLDTPGLDACQKDDEMAFKGYEDADVILFVHNLQEGELNQIEIDAINKISELFGDNKEIFFKNVILVLSCKDQKEEEYNSIKAQINKQCDKIFGYKFQQIFGVNSVGYLKGKLENKQLLMKESGIEELIDLVDVCVRDKYDLQKNRYIKEKNEIISLINNYISKQEMEKSKYRYEEIDKIKDLKEKVKRISEETIRTVNGKSAKADKVENYKYLGRGRDYKEYSSESSARSAGREAIETAIKKIASRAKSDAKDAVSSLENYISPNGVPTEIRNIMSEAYEKIRVAIGGMVSIRNFDITIKACDNSLDKLHSAYEKARYIDINSFSSVHYYETSYSSNLYIDYDYKTKWVKGLFGEKEKQVAVYRYDADGAIDDVGNDGRDLVNEIINEAQSAVSSEFSKIKEDLLKQFNDLVRVIIANIDIELQRIEKSNGEKKAAVMEIDKRISEINALKESL